MNEHAHKILGTRSFSSLMCTPSLFYISFKPLLHIINRCSNFIYPLPLIAHPNNGYKICVDIMTGEKMSSI